RGVVPGRQVARVPDARGTKGRLAHLDASSAEGRQVGRAATHRDTSQVPAGSAGLRRRRLPTDLRRAGRWRNGSADHDGSVGGRRTRGGRGWEGDRVFLAPVGGGRAPL